jgi:hypothetical protein
MGCHARVPYITNEDLLERPAAFSGTVGARPAWPYQPISPRTIRASGKGTGIRRTVQSHATAMRDARRMTVATQTHPDQPQAARPWLVLVFDKDPTARIAIPAEGLLLDR